MNISRSLSHISGLRPLAVLVVDHDAASTQRTVLQLEEANCDALCLASGAEALGYLQTARRRLDMVLMSHFVR